MNQVANKNRKSKETDVPRLKRKEYDQKLRKLHVELVKLQEWVKREGKKICVVFEGRDGAGKGGVIKAMTERVSPRVFRVVALAAPTEREKSQMYIQRYLQHFPSGGEIVIFDRSWYNRAGVERVMGFCTEDQAKRFLSIVPAVEKAMVESGVVLLKYWLEVSPEEQTNRLTARIDDKRKIWKLSQMDLDSYTRWDDYTRCRDDMFQATDTVVGAMVCRSIRQQEAGAAQYHLAPALEYSLQESAPREYQVAETQDCPQQAASRFAEDRSAGRLVNAPSARRSVRPAEGRDKEAGRTGRPEGAPLSSTRLFRSRWRVCAAHPGRTDLDPILCKPDPTHCRSR